MNTSQQNALLISTMKAIVALYKGEYDNVDLLAQGPLLEAKSDNYVTWAESTLAQLERSDDPVILNRVPVKVVDTDRTGHGGTCSLCFFGMSQGYRLPCPDDQEEVKAHGRSCSTHSIYYQRA